MDISQSLRAISRHYCVDEGQCVKGLLPLISASSAQCEAISAQAQRWVNGLRETAEASLLQDMLDEYALDTEEGQALMVLAESLLRIPDSAVANALIADQLQRGDWQGQSTRQHGWFAQSAAVLLEWTGHWLAEEPASTAVSRLLKKFSAPVVHRAMTQMIRLLAGQFVFAETIDAAVIKARGMDNPQQAYSFDMLGEAAVCEQQSQAFFEAYLQAIHSIGQSMGEGAHISIKLSALSPRFEVLQADTVVPELVQRLEPLFHAALEQGVAITLDAEEAERLELMLAVFSDCFTRWGSAFAGRLGLALQAYSTRALPVLAFLDELAQSRQAPIAVRLVKGAYWDTEIKTAQLQGLAHFPVFTHKRHTDLSYLACAQQLLATHGWLRPQFATHNPVTISHILTMASADAPLEFQRLHGMGEALYEQVLAEHDTRLCRVYSPVGGHQSLLPYLVRRILENGANNSFVRQLASVDLPVEQLCRHPLQSDEDGSMAIRAPQQLYGKQRRNSPTVNLAAFEEREQLQAALQDFQANSDAEQPLLANAGERGVSEIAVTRPADGKSLGCYYAVSTPQVTQALQDAHIAFDHWRKTLLSQRVEAVQRFAGLLHQHRTELLALLIHEAGKTIGDAINEWREAIDFCYYYAAQAQQQFAGPQVLPGPDGEHNALFWEGRGVFLCISPWNFPLAIFVGQVSAALLAGNTVLAKPAEQTSLIACRVVRLMYEAGVPRDVLQCLPGEGGPIAAALLPDSRLAGVAFTGSLATAQHINRRLAQREGAIIPLIAETGGQNAMLVDSSALPEQVVRDVIHSAFYAAGQRCSALRVLFLQREVHDEMLELLIRATATLRIGDPGCFATDIGPVISETAAQQLQAYIADCERQQRIIHAAPLPQGLNTGRYIAPHIIRVSSMLALTAEQFGPILHVCRFDYDDLDAVLADINRSGYGLTAGVHSRDQAFCQHVAQALQVGNVYLNREMTGAVVGVQPFGGRGLSGTGPKAGGPHYLQRFATEKTVSNNIAAIGGSVNLLVDTRRH